MEKKTKKRVRFTNAGREVVEVELTPEQIATEEQAKVEAVEMTRAQIRLMRLKKQAKPLVLEPLTINGETWYPRQLDWPGLTLMRLDIASTELNAACFSGFRRLCAALLYRGLAASQGDPDSLYFENLLAALEFVRDPDPAIKEQVDGLFDVLATLNPDALPKAPKAPGAAAETK